MKHSCPSVADIQEKFNFRFNFRMFLEEASQEPRPPDPLTPDPLTPDPRPLSPPRCFGFYFKLFRKVPETSKTPASVGLPEDDNVDSFTHLQLNFPTDEVKGRPEKPIILCLLEKIFLSVFEQLSFMF